MTGQQRPKSMRTSPPHAEQVLQNQPKPQRVQFDEVNAAAQFQ